MNESHERMYRRDSYVMKMSFTIAFALHKGKELLLRIASQFIALLDQFRDLNKENEKPCAQ